MNNELERNGRKKLSLNENSSNNFHFLKTNLKLLNFADLYTKEESAMSENSFNKTNSSLMCTILYFLINKFDSSLKEKFSFCFPVATLKELKTFKDTIFPEILSIFKEEINSGTLVISKSILDSASGERLVSLLRKFSDKVLKSEIYKLKTAKSNLNANNQSWNNLQLNSNSILGLNNLYATKQFSEWKRRMLITNLVLDKNKLIKNSYELDKLQSEWKSYSSYLENEIQNLEKAKVVIQKKYKHFKERENDSSIFSEISSLDRAPKLENLKLFRELVDKLNEQLNNKSEFVNNLDYINENTSLYDTISKDLFKENENKESVILLHEKVKEFNALIKTTSVNNQPNSKLKEIKDILELTTTKNKQVLEKINSLFLNLSTK